MIHMDWKDVNWGSVADWVSGIGSLAAAISAVYLARSAQKIKLQGHFGHRLILGTGRPTREVISIGVTNIGNRTTTVRNIGIRSGLFKKRYGIIMVGQSDISESIPKTIADGEQGNWSIPLQGNPNWIADLCEKFVTTKLDVLTLRVQIHTTNGGTTNIKAEKGLRERLFKEIEKKYENAV